MKPDQPTGERTTGEWTCGGDDVQPKPRKEDRVNTDAAAPTGEHSEACNSGFPDYDCPICGNQLRRVKTDQPKPATGEWTLETVSELLSASFDEGGEDGFGLRAIADAHNAAIAAAFKRGKLEGVFASPDEGEINYVTGLERQLAAERERLERIANQAIDKRETEIQQLREQQHKAKEAESEAYGAYQEAYRQCEQLRKQLATAVEALKAYEKNPYTQGNLATAALAKIGGKS